MISCKTTHLRAAVSNQALAGEDLPARIKILKWGTNDSTQGKFFVGEGTLSVLPEKQRRFGRGRIAIDFNHSSEPSSPEYEKLLKAGQPPIILGYGHPTVIRDDGLWLEDVQWTPLGMQTARNFEDLSPSVATDDAREVDYVSSVALTPNGSLHDVTFFSAQAGQPPIRGRARLVAALGLANARRANLTASRAGIPTPVVETGAGRRRVLAMLAADGKAPVNPATSKAYTEAELRGLDLGTLRLLYENTPATKFRSGYDRMLAAAERENASRGKR